MYKILSLIFMLFFLSCEDNRTKVPYIEKQFREHKSEFEKMMLYTKEIEQAFPDSIRVIKYEEDTLIIGFGFLLPGLCCSYRHSEIRFNTDSLKRNLYRFDKNELSNKKIQYVYNFMHTNKITFAGGGSEDLGDDFSMIFGDCFPIINIRHLCDSCYHNSVVEERFINFNSKNTRDWAYKLDNRWYLYSYSPTW